jgi:hypothetical protein
MLRSCLSMLSIEGLFLLDVSIRTGLLNLKLAVWIRIRQIVSEMLIVVRYCERSNASKS